MDVDACDYFEGPPVCESLGIWGRRKKEKGKGGEAIKRDGGVFGRVEDCIPGLALPQGRSKTKSRRALQFHPLVIAGFFS